MITFLRKIRRSLIDSGSAGKYLIYAIGEILLVMIGILLALQVNNWNENRRNLQKVKAHMESLKSDLQADLKDVEFQYQEFIGMDNAGLRMWDFITGKLTDFDTTSLKEDLMLAGGLPDFSNRTTAYDNLTGSGDIHLIDDDVLKELLATYFKGELWKGLNLDQRIRYTQDYYDKRFDFMDPFMLREFLKSYFNETYFKREEIAPPPLEISLAAFAVDWEALKNDKEFKVILGRVISQRTASEWRFVDIKNQIKKILDHLENKELELR